MLGGITPVCSPYTNQPPWGAPSEILGPPRGPCKCPWNVSPKPAAKGGACQKPKNKGQNISPESSGPNQQHNNPTRVRDSEGPYGCKRPGFRSSPFSNSRFRDSSVRFSGRPRWRTDMANARVPLNLSRGPPPAAGCSKGGAWAKQSASSSSEDTGRSSSMGSATDEGRGVPETDEY